MQEIIISMLFLYPGAMVDVFEKYFFKYSYRQDESGEVAHLARYFAYSVVITIASIFIFAHFRQKSVANLEDIASALNGMIELGWYAGISLFASLMFTLLFHALNKLFVAINSRITEKTEGLKVINASDTWHELAYGVSMAEYRDAAIIRIKNDKEERIGFVKVWPERYEDGILLTQTDIVKEYFDYDREISLDQQDKMFIGSPLYTMFDAKTASFIEIYDGRKLYAYLFPEDKEESPAIVGLWGKFRAWFDRGRR